MSADGAAPSIDLHRVFTGQEDVLRTQLHTGKQAGHPGVQGDGTEHHWIELLRTRLPRRYDVTKAIVVDSTGARSDQIDMVVYDRQYSPEFWEQGDHRYVPAESVYAVFEIKPEFNREYVRYASNKIASVRRLTRTSNSFGWAGGTHGGHGGFEPLGGILCTTSTWSPAFGAPLLEALRSLDPPGRLDLGCVLGHGAFEISDRSTPGNLTISEPAVALVSFLLILLRRLQSLGSAPALDYAAYEQSVRGGTHVGSSTQPG
jgi:hypothetical protein